MTVQKRSLGVVSSTIAATKSIESTHNKVVSFADLQSADITLPVGCPVAYDEDAGGWMAWSPTAAATSGDGFEGVIRGFVYPEAIVLDADGETLGSVMFAGRISYTDIDITQCAGGDATTLKAAIEGEWAGVHANTATFAATGGAATLRALGIIVEDLEEVR